MTPIYRGVNIWTQLFAYKTPKLKLVDDRLAQPSNPSARRFVVLHHTFAPDSLPQTMASSREVHALNRANHFDLMLQQNTALATWVLPNWPPRLAKGISWKVLKLADHRLAYLNLTGSVSGDRGQVQRVDEGQFEVQEQTLTCWKVDLAGKNFDGQLTLRKCDDDPEDHRWDLSIG